MFVILGCSFSLLLPLSFVRKRQQWVTGFPALRGSFSLPPVQFPVAAVTIPPTLQLIPAETPSSGSWMSIPTLLAGLSSLVALGGIVPGLPLPCTLARSPRAPCSMGLHPSLGLHRHVLLSLCLMLDSWSTLLHSDLTLTSQTCSDPASKSRHVLRSQDVHFARQYSA